jgi:predicted nucleotidyltransferase
VIYITKPKDRDFIETIDGYLFCVLGYLHPPDGYTAYLKYITSKNGKWERNGTKYDRSIPYYQVSQVEKTYKYLKNNHPEYLFQCKVRNIEISWVPKKRVKRYYYPRNRLNEIQIRGPKDPLEDKLLQLTNIFTSSSVIPGSFGVTGSILTETHNPKFSDIDITVYGKKESHTLKEALLDLKQESKDILGMTKRQKHEWVQNRRGKFQLSTEDLWRIVDRRWNYGYFKDVYFSVHPTYLDEEINENYGDNVYNRIKEVCGTAVVTDSTDSIFNPATYKVSECSPLPDVSEIVSFEGIFGGLFEEGDRIKFKGVLEEIKGKNPHKRVIIGGAASKNSYIKRLSYSG